MFDILFGLYNSWWTTSNSLSLSNSKKLFLEYRWKQVILYLFFIYFKKGYTSWKKKKGGGAIASLVAQTVKRLPAKWETRVRFLGWEYPWRRKWQSTPALLPGKSHGWRSLIGYSPWGRKESDTTERLHCTSWKRADEMWLVVNNFNTLHNVFCVHKCVCCSKPRQPLLPSLTCLPSPSLI